MRALIFNRDAVC